jgi:hypothetical protein
MGQAQDAVGGLPRPAQEAVTEYLRAHGLAAPSRADVVLALLRVNTQQSLAAAEGIVGRPVTRCPPAIPLWPPKPVVRAPRAPRVKAVGRNPCLPTSGAFQRYRTVRVGMTRDQLLARGVTHRDLRKWAKHVEFTQEGP